MIETLRNQRPSTTAWLSLIGGVALYDVLAPKGETLSERVDDLLEHDKLRYVALGGIAITALHLANGFERLGLEKYDPFHRALSWKQ